MYRSKRARRAEDEHFPSDPLTSTIMSRIIGEISLCVRPPCMSDVQSHAAVTPTNS